MESAAIARIRVALVPPGALAPIPATFGIPLPRGRWSERGNLRLETPEADALPLQVEVTDRWPDGSARWILADTLVPIGIHPGDELRLVIGEGRGDGDAASVGGRDAVRVVGESASAVEVDTGAMHIRFERGHGFPFAVAGIRGAQLDIERSKLVLEDASGRSWIGVIREIAVEARGPVRACVRLRGAFEADGAAPGAGAPPPLELEARAHVYAGRSSVRLLFTLRNPRRASHPGGHWELGDVGSVLLRDLTLELALPRCTTIAWRAEQALPVTERREAQLEIVQESSGGEHWQSRVHLDRDRKIPPAFRGYEERVAGDTRRGLRASPWAALHDGEGGVAIHPRWFWQNFPMAIAAAPRALALRLFPRSSSSLHEIQGGEQKTHEFTIALGAEALAPASGLDATPALVHPEASWLASTGAVAYLIPRQGPSTLHDRLVDQAIEGDDTFEAKRERVDEYGWRHFGELWADHEAKFHEGPGEFVSHYNNQYDVVYGAFLQFARTGDVRWWHIHEELTRHVVDIDVYHTTEDKPAYNQGLFWHTVHYVDADLATHRSYPKRGSHGGGPDNEHNYTTGLLHHYFATGDPSSRETVLGSARWVIDADDGRATVFRWIDRGPTGLATKTRQFAYHGPGRGAGNSLNALLDGWRLTRDDRLLAKAREVLRRTIHPEDDVARRTLLDAEERWSYTVFLQALGKFLDAKAESNELDADYAYARDALLAYVRWMADHERPILDTPEQLEYPNETWAAQDVRKSDVFLFGAMHTRGAERERFLERERFFFHRSLETLDASATKSFVRPVILLMHYGLMHAWFEAYPDASRPQGPRTEELGKPRTFVPQKTRAIAKLKRGAVAVAVLFAAGAAILAWSYLRCHSAV